MVINNRTLLYRTRNHNMLPRLNVSILKPDLGTNLNFFKELVHAEYDGAVVHCGFENIHANVFIAAAVSQLDSMNLHKLKYGEFYSSALWYINSRGDNSRDKQRLRVNLNSFLILRGDTRNIEQLFML
jgi:hypothetical protein